MVTVNIQPPNEIYGTFARLNYQPWYAIAEFVDNATQNFFERQRELAAADGEPLLKVDIDYDTQSSSLSISDNAHGMGLDELTRAMKIGTPPPDRSGRSEFGMGMKTAACWFGPRWSVSTTQLGSAVRYRVVFDIEELAGSGASSIEVQEEPAGTADHGTTIRIDDLRKPIVGRQIEKIRKLLTSMYRVDLKTGGIEIRWKGQTLHFTDPALWQQEREDGSIEELRQRIDTCATDPATGDEHIVTGWVGVLQTMSSNDNGFALLRRGRVIIGGPEGGWRPQTLLGNVGAPQWKRLVGEIHLDDFPVNFTKDGFAWDGGLEDALIDALDPLVSTYRAFATNLRVKPKGGGAAPGDFVRVIEEVQEGVNEPSFRRDVTQVTTPAPPGLEIEPETFEATAAERVPVVLEVPFPSGTMRATLYVKDEGQHAPWLALKPVRNDDLDILLNTAHRFVAASVEDEKTRMVIGKVALAVALAEQQARTLYGDNIPAEEVRLLMSTILLHALT